MIKHEYNDIRKENNLTKRKIMELDNEILDLISIVYSLIIIHADGFSYDKTLEALSNKISQRNALNEVLKFMEYKS